MIKGLLIVISSWFCTTPSSSGVDEPSYQQYHHQITEAEKYITAEQYSEALGIYEAVFEEYDFVFLRDYKVAAQLAYYLEDVEKTSEIVRIGILAGWSKKSIRKNKLLAGFRKTEAWTKLRKDYKRLQLQYEASLNTELRKKVKKMFSKDQGKALGALFKFSSNAQDRYGEKKFAPHSEQQMAEVIDILEEYGYPGEQLIGHDYWMSTIISHHNSISQNYVSKDTLYPEIRDDLKLALEKGQISPFEFALMEEWYLTVRSGWEEPGGYGILGSPTENSLSIFNSQRAKCLLRPIELRNQLVEIQKKTGMDFYLPGEPWIDGKIEIRQETP